MIFPWRSMDSAPRDGSTFVCLGFVTFCGGETRPIDLVPDLMTLHRAGVDPQSGGYWMESRHRCSRADMQVSHGYWMPLVEFAPIVEDLLGWQTAPTDRGPLVFVRPVEPRARYHFSHDVYAADIVWPFAGGWTTAKSMSGACHPGYLDGTNQNGQPFRWCALADFVPEAVFERDRERSARVAAYMAQREASIAPKVSLVPQADPLVEEL